MLVLILASFLKELAYGDKIILGTDLSDEKLTYTGEATPDSYKNCGKSRDSIGYHAALDHYGIDLENGNMFEWAKDISANDRYSICLKSSDVY